MVKKKLVLTAAVLAAVTVISGCQGNAQSQQGNAAGAKEEKAKEDVSWPSGDITIYVPNAAGSSNDLTCRVFATYLEKAAGCTVTVMNNGEGGGITAYEEVRNAKPDGSKLLWQHTGINVSYWTGNYDYRPDEAFIAIGSISIPGVQAYCAQADAPYSNLDELVEYAKANPDTIRYGVKLGNATHITGCQIENALGLKFKMVDASDQSARLSALLGNNLDVGSMDVLTAEQYVQEGDLKILFTTLPYGEYDNASEWNDGILDFMASGGTLLWGPAGMDEALIAAINDTMKKASEDAEVKEQITALGQNMNFMDCAAATELVKNDMAAKRDACTAAGLNTHEGEQ